MSAAFMKGSRGQIYLPTRTGKLVQRSAGIDGDAMLKELVRMRDHLAERAETREFLYAVAEGRKVQGRKLTLFRLYEQFYAPRRLDDLRAELSAVPLAGHLDAWGKWVRRNTDNPTTATTYRAQVETLVTGTFTSADLTPATVSRWLSELPDVTSGTRRKYLYALYSFVAYLLEMTVLTENPIKGRVASPAKNKKRERWETEATDRAIVDAVNPTREARPLAARIRAALAFVMASTTDVGYALPPHFKLRHLDLDQGTAHVKGKTSRRLVNRVVFIEPWALPRLRAYVAEMALGPNDDVFPGVTRHMLHHHHEQGCKAAGVVDYTLKDARHSCAVRWRLKGMSWEWIADLLGNTVYQVTETYAHITRTLEDRLAEVQRATESKGEGKPKVPYLVNPTTTARATADEERPRAELRRDD